MPYQPSKPVWCRHIVWCDSFELPSVSMLITLPEGYYFDGNKIEPEWRACPICLKPRPKKKAKILCDIKNTKKS